MTHMNWQEVIALAVVGLVGIKFAWRIFAPVLYRRLAHKNLQRKKIERAIRFFGKSMVARRRSPFHFMCHEPYEKNVTKSP